MKYNKLLLGVLCAGLLVSCGPTTSPSEYPTTDESTGTTDESTITSEEPIEYVDLATAFTNTKKGYALYGVGLVNKRLFEAYRSDLYINNLYRTGFVILPEDSSFTHQFAIANDPNYDVVKEVITMYGRVGDKSVIPGYENQTFFPVVNSYFDSFEKVDENTYRVRNAASLAYDLKNYFQDNTVKYCTTFDLDVGADGCLEYLKGYEGDEENLQQTVKFKFEKLESYSELEMMKDWVDAGSKINVRLVDYKFLYRKLITSSPISVYYGEEIEYEGIVANIDTDNNLYVGSFDEEFGYVALKVEGHGSEYEVGDKVVVKGTITTKSLMTYVEKATITDLGKKGDFVPVYDEESLVDTYGGGTYAARLFAQNPPLFAHSTYSTYAYVSSYDINSTNEQNTIKLVFPSYRDENNTTYSPTLYLPKNLSSDKTEEILNYLKTITLYKESTGGTEISIQNIIVEADFDVPFYQRFVVTEHTIIGNKLTAEEKINRNLGIENFPIIQDVETTAFTFGGFQSMTLEYYYNLDQSNPTKGLFISYNDIDAAKYNAYLKELEDFGCEKVDEVKDIQNKRHIVYNVKNSSHYVAVAYFNDGYSTPRVDVWVYNVEKPVLPLTIEEKLKDKASDVIDLDEFIRASDTYTADYLLFELDTYAGKLYKDEPLICYTINSKQSTATEYAKLLIKNLGYKQYRENGVDPYSYITRGKSHYVLVSPKGTFVDIACYPTTDYTYSGHDEFEYRIECLVYDAEAPIKVKTYKDLSVLTKSYRDVDESLDYAKGVVLPEDVVVEYWLDTGLKNIDYGYGSREEAFVYTDDLHTLWDNLIETIIANGYNRSINKPTRAAFSLYRDGIGYYIALLLEVDKGYIRIMNDVMGAAFA